MTAPAPARTTDTGHSSPKRTLFLASLGFFLITLDILIVNVALTRISDDLGGGTTGQQWIIDGYTLLFASLLLFAGNLADRIGAKRALGTGIALFLLSSIACALAPTVGALIAARFVQGAAAAAMLPSSMALIREAFPDARERARALGVWAVGGAVAGAVGPLLGGLLTTIDWRLVFLINIPVCAVMLVLLRWVAPSPTTSPPFDLAGQALSLAGLGALMYGLIEGGAIGFDDPLVLGCLALAVLALSGFLVVQQRARHPMMPPDLFRSRNMRLALLVGFAFMVGNFGSVFVVSLYLQQHLGLTPLLAGLAFLPSAAFAVVGNIVSGRLANRFGPRLPIVGGLATMAVGLLGLLAAAPLGAPLLVSGLLVLTGAGGSVAMPPATAVVLASVPPHRASTASAVFNTFRQIGGAVAIAVFGALLAGSDFVDGMRTSMLIAAAVLVLAAAAGSFVTPREQKP
ncbi:MULTISPECIES: MFS transporter [unclassified Rathayibacter]|uniref:MFS transporter n=1 Tax=unclassified Rathayibacter TaxID=2609250 RepID=UPI001FB24DB6|nr:MULTISPECIES: MFS transporter [unclassified Rathayibacter]MCJ1674469.1 MFS transporter [Rathayibacter sp. VKM Ac-2929]MCJ1684750.1 MFS transporter [Rathayibacter sp. VKM Ac-2928]